MAWRDKLKQASFRNVKFETEHHSIGGGRRVASHEYPNRDVPYVEDMGAKQRTFSLNAFVIGSDYMDRRDALIRVLEMKGPGLLVHPYLGSITVMVDTYSMEETSSEGGMARFSIDFIQSEAIRYPEQVSNPATEISKNGQTVIAKNAVIADKNISTAGPSVVLENAVSDINAIASKLKDEGKNISRTKSTLIVGISGKINDIDEYLKEANRLANNAYAYANQPATLVYQISNVVSRIPNIVDTALNAFRAYTRMFGYVFDYFDAQSWIGTASGLASMNNAAYIRNMTLSSILSYAAQSALNIEYETNAQAYGVRTSLSDMFDKLLNIVDDDSLYESIADLKNSTVKSIPPEGVRLQDIVNVSINEPIPSLVFVNDQYGDIDNEDDFIQRNKIQNPWIIPGGSIVEVLK